MQILNRLLVKVKNGSLGIDVGNEDYGRGRLSVTGAVVLQSKFCQNAQKALSLKEIEMRFGRMRRLSSVFPFQVTCPFLVTRRIWWPFLSVFPF